MNFAFVADAQAGDAVYVPNFSCSDGPYALVLPSSYSELKRLAPLIDEQTADVDESDHTQRKQIQFDGLDLRVITSRDEPDRYMVALASIAKPMWAIAGPFRIGQSWAQVRADMLKRGVDLGHALSFGSEGGGVTFTLDGNVVSRIDYACYTG